MVMIWSFSMGPFVTLAGLSSGTSEALQASDQYFTASVVGDSARQRQ